MSRQPWPFQETAIEFGTDRNILLADECGLGKTLMTIEMARRTSSGPVLVVCPNSTKLQWKNEIKEQYPNERVIILGVAGRVPTGEYLEHLFSPSPTATWVISHYEGVRLNYQLLAKYTWSSIIADEAHRIKNRKAKQSRALAIIPSSHRIAATGTPLERAPHDLWGILNWLHPDQFTSYWKFYNEFVREEMSYSGFPKIVGSKNRERLGALLQPIYLRRTKHEVLPDLPPKIYQTVDLTFPKEQAALYKVIKNARDIEVEHASLSSNLLIINTLARLTRLSQVSVHPRMEPFNTNIQSTKIEWCRDYIRDNPGIPMLVFSRFAYPPRSLASEFDAGILLGSKHRRLGDKGVDHFKAGKTDVLFGTLDALGESHDLGRASRAIFLDQHWSSRVMEQAYDRIHRATATEPKHIIKLRVRGTVDDLIETSLTHKWTEQQLIYAAVDELRAA